jgi:hypothetical protein
VIIIDTEPILGIPIAEFTREDLRDEARVTAGNISQT